MYVVIDDRISGWRKVVGVFRTIKKAEDSIRSIWKKDNAWRKRTGNQTYFLDDYKKSFDIEKVVIDKLKIKI